ncbi:nucleotidyl transferase AbiEii/AbiGii toxin family protein [Algoriphagus antarcticus]|uniref:Nucleotidyltransferase AbiEii toxin of type IV toxin-antitoxin system n=1 Tax=Algoriphagus antarcticus TaxID=238540 RepID=A0A3E0E8B5_9BACT|nr:nucleotidyl transferase AbiEii/AbiGii toxin family protein [Algoriphagus antarcticus]REG94482.1 nucleotidyltransferase AbiEii toxin of type IV toxin-antitoxin system [Algoriphagus antarcticus]
MKLHESESLFRDAIVATAQRFDIPDIYIEKDYWVTYALYTIFGSVAKTFAVFKGGTALAKCYGIIERFSEDIDMVALNETGDSGNKLKEKLKKISKAIETMLPETEVQGITNKRGMIRKTAHAYPKQFQGDFGQVRDFIMLESTWLGYHEPHSDREISSFISQMMLETGQEEMAKEYNLMPFKVCVLAPTRTICEKIMSLVRFSHTVTPIEDLRLKIRHCYDLHQLLRLDELSAFLDGEEFEVMLKKVAQDDVEGYKSNNQWLAIHPKEAIIFKETNDTWNALKSAYLGGFSDLVYGKLPDEKDIFETISRIASRLQTMSWTINPNAIT